MKFYTPKPWVKDPDQSAELTVKTIGEASRGGKALKGAARRPGREEDHTDPQSDNGGYLVRMRKGNATTPLLKREVYGSDADGRGRFPSEQRMDGQGEMAFSTTPPAYSGVKSGASVLNSIFSV